MKKVKVVISIVQDKLVGMILVLEIYPGIWTQETKDHLWQLRYLGGDLGISHLHLEMLIWGLGRVDQDGEGPLG
jgi:hypothetical protein